MKENGKMTKEMAKEFILIRTEKKNMKENGKMTKEMVKEL